MLRCFKDWKVELGFHVNLLSTLHLHNLSTTSYTTVAETKLEPQSATDALMLKYCSSFISLGWRLWTNNSDNNLYDV